MWQYIHNFEKWLLGRLERGRIILKCISEMKMWINFHQPITVKPFDTATRDLVVSTTYLRLLIATFGLNLEDDGCSLPECRILTFKFFWSRRIFTKLFMSFLSSQVKASKSRFDTTFSTYLALDGLAMLIWNRKPLLLWQVWWLCLVPSHKVTLVINTLLGHPSEHTQREL